MSDDNPPFPGPPRPISEKVVDITLTGNLIPWRDNTPDYITMNGTADLFLPVYTVSELLYQNHVDDGNLTVKQIQDGHEFLDDLPYWIEPGKRLRVIVDMYVTPQKTTRFREVFREPPEQPAEPSTEPLE